MSSKLRITPDMDDIDLKVLGDITLHGWSDIAVFPVPESPGLPFNYTVGLTDKNHPELLLQGMSNTQAHSILAWVFKMIDEQGQTFEANRYYDDVLAGGMRVAFVDVPHILSADFPMSMAWRFYGNDMSGLHLVWPDVRGHFPWQKEFDPYYLDRQELSSPWKGE